MSELFKFSEETLGELLPVYGSELETVVQALKTPGKRYFVRANMVKTTPKEVAARLTERGFDISQHELIPEALWVPIQGPFEVSARPKKVMADKFIKEIDGGMHKRWSMWLNSMQREEPYLALTCKW